MPRGEELGGGTGDNLTFYYSKGLYQKDEE
jgi:hypothetical protein